MSFTAFNATPAKALSQGPSKVTIDLLQKAFSDRPDLVSRLKEFASRDEALVHDVSEWVLHLKETLPSTSTNAETVLPISSKKRKLDDGVAANGSTAGWADKNISPDFSAPDISFSIPQRKKLRLEWIDSSSSDPEKGGIRAADPSGNIEFGVNWRDIDQIFCLPVPEKTKRQHNFVVIPDGASGLVPTAPGAPEPIIWTAFEPAAKDTEAPKEPGHTAGLLVRQLKAFGKAVVYPDEGEFKSAIVQSHRKGEVAFHVKAHRGSKDGFLYFLGPGILWAFKKPLLFLPYSAITSISYTSVLQRTFNLNIAVSYQSTDGSMKEEEVEFSMLDQADFAGIDEYVKRHGLNDASLAAGRRAKRYGVNDPKTKEEVNGKEMNGDKAAGGESMEEDELGDGETELQKAERMLQDEEDELEEDYVDEGSDDGSGSEGEYSEEEGYADAGGQDGAEGFDAEQEFEEEEGGYEDDES